MLFPCIYLVERPSDPVVGTVQISLRLLHFFDNFWSKIKAQGQSTMSTDITTILYTTGNDEDTATFEFSSQEEAQLWRKEVKYIHDLIDDINNGGAPGAFHTSQILHFQILQVVGYC